MRRTKYLPATVNPKQEAFLSLTCKEALFGGAAGGSKGLHVETPIPTPNGYRLMGELQPEDIVFDPSGQPCTITAASTVHYRRCFRVEFDDGTFLIADDEHQWFTLINSDREALLRRTDSYRNRRKSTRPSRAKIVISKPWVQCTITASNRAREYVYLSPVVGAVRTTLDILRTLHVRADRANHSIDVTQPLILPEAALPIDPYSLGLYLGDGNRSDGSIGMMESDIDELRCFIPYTLKSQNVYGPPKYKRPFKKVRFNELSQLLRKMGLLAAKQVPNEYFRASVSQRLALLQGLMDSDGCAALDGGCAFSNMNHALAEAVYELAVSLGIKATMRTGRAKLYGRDIGRNWLVRFTTSLPVFRLSRKLTRLKKITRDVGKRRYIVDVREIPTVPTRCIAVDSPSRCYLAGKAMVPTHNTFALLMGGLQYADIPSYSALIVRKHSTDLYKAKGLIDTADSWLKGTGASWNGSRKRWTFPTTGDPAILEFGHFDSKSSGEGVFGQSGPTYQYIGVDELTEFEENEYKFLFRSLRKPEGMKVPLRMRAGTNPIGRGAVWVKQHFITEGKQNGRVFMPSKIDDNLYLNREEYVKSLSNLDAYTRAQLLDGNWDAKPPGSKFRREWFKRMPVAPVRPMPWVRFWDLAATAPAPGKDPSWTAGVKMGYDGSYFYIADVRRDRLSPKGVEDMVIRVAEEDGSEVYIRMEQEGGSGGKNTIAHYMTLLNRYYFKGFQVTGRGSKEIRANPLSSQAEAGNVVLIQGPWNSAFLDEIEQFPGGQYGDQVDAASGAYWCLTEDAAGDMEDIYAGGELPQPDW